jgi:uncharacterized protein YjbI with pentapeptide repeats
MSVSQLRDIVGRGTKQLEQTRSSKAWSLSMNILGDSRRPVLPDDKDLKSRSRQIILGALGLGLLLAAIRLGYSLPWTGIAEYHGPNGEHYRSKSLWDWMQLLLLPGVVALAATWLRKRQVEHPRETEGDPRPQAVEWERERLSEEVLQRWFDGTGKLMLDNGLRTSPPEHDVRQLARARTLAALRELDAKRKGLLLRFLHESNLILKHQASVDLQGADFSGADLNGAILDSASLYAVDLSGANLAIVNLNGAELRKADLSGTDLSGSDLRATELNAANLTGALLTVADLRGGNLSEADLIGANLAGGDLQGTNLSGANLSGANLRGANLTGANMTKANLHVIELSGANLSHADLSGANLKDATLSEADLDQANLTGAQLKRADLRGVAGLIQAQIDLALGNDQTRLPQGIGRPKTWS